MYSVSITVYPSFSLPPPPPPFSPFSTDRTLSTLCTGSEVALSQVGEIGGFHGIRLGVWRLVSTGLALQQT